MALKHASKRLEDANAGKIVIFDEEKKALQCKHDCFEYYKKVAKRLKKKKNVGAINHWYRTRRWRKFQDQETYTTD